MVNLLLVFPNSSTVKILNLNCHTVISKVFIRFVSKQSKYDPTNQWIKEKEAGAKAGTSLLGGREKQIHRIWKMLHLPCQVIGIIVNICRNASISSHQRASGPHCWGPLRCTVLWGSTCRVVCSTYRPNNKSLWGSKRKWPMWQSSVSDSLPFPAGSC